MTRSIIAASTLVVLAGSLLAAPPTPSPSGITGKTYSAAATGEFKSGVPVGRPRGAAYVSNMNPDARPAVLAATVRVSELKFTDTQDVIVYTPTRPVRVRIETLFEGKHVAEMWKERMRKAFDYFDRDKNGTLNGFESGLIFSDLGLNLMLQNGYYQPTPQDRPSLDRIDSDGDRRVSFDEFLAYYKTSASLLLRAQPPTPENPYNTGVTEALFKMLDANGDGKLTKDEVKAVEKLLATKDADEDECLNMTELVPNMYDPRFVRQPQPVQPYNPGAMPQAANQIVNVYAPDRIPGIVTQQVIKKYDKDGDFELTRTESGFDDATFARLDKDGNGKLDGEELEAWRLGAADLDVTLSLAPKAVDCVAKVVTDAKDASARGFEVRQLESGRLVIRCGRQPMEFWAFTAVLQYQQPAFKQQYQYLFTQAAGTRGFVEDKDLNGPNAVQFQFLRTVFDAADGDANGKLTKAEFDGFFDLQDSFRNLALSVTPAVQTPTLFQILDENRDNRLSVRELRTAWDRLVLLEPGGGDVITKAAIQPAVSLRLTRSMERFYVNQQNQYYNPNTPVAVPQKGPIWFRKMDRNGDGDVSRIEFLGTKAEFDAMDTDKDALLSLAEAEAFDKKMRVVDEKK